MVKYNKKVDDDNNLNMDRVFYKHLFIVYTSFVLNLLSTFFTYV
jgi:hypothetical protein